MADIVIIWGTEHCERNRYYDWYYHDYKQKAIDIMINMTQILDIGVHKTLISLLTQNLANPNHYYYHYCNRHPPYSYFWRYNSPNMYDGSSFISTLTTVTTEFPESTRNTAEELNDDIGNPLNIMRYVRQHVLPQGRSDVQVNVCFLLKSCQSKLIIYTQNELRLG